MNVGTNQPSMAEMAEKRLASVIDELLGVSDSIMQKVDRFSPLVHNPSKPMAELCDQSGFIGAIERRVDQLHLLNDKLRMINENLSRIIG